MCFIETGRWGLQGMHTLLTITLSVRLLIVIFKIMATKQCVGSLLFYSISMDTRTMRLGTPTRLKRFDSKK